MCKGSFVGKLRNSINSEDIQNFRLYFQPIKRNVPRKWKFEMVWSDKRRFRNRERSRPPACEINDIDVIAEAEADIKVLKDIVLFDNVD